MLPIDVARSSSGGVTKSQGKGQILGDFFPIDNALYGSYSGLDFATKDRFGLNLLILRKAWQNLISDY